VPSPWPIRVSPSLGLTTTSILVPTGFANGADPRPDGATVASDTSSGCGQRAPMRGEEHGQRIDLANDLVVAGIRGTGQGASRFRFSSGRAAKKNGERRRSFPRSSLDAGALLLDGEGPGEQARNERSPHACATMSQTVSGPPPAMGSEV
jgi:hypothetical protein